MQADAKLIAAAPELAEALVGLLDQLEGIGIYVKGLDGGQWAGTEGLWFYGAEAALRKAGALDD